MNKSLFAVMALTIFLFGCSDTPGTGTSLGETISTVTTLKEMTELMAKGPTGQYAVTYEMDFGEEASTVEMTTYWKNAERYRIDTLAEGIESRAYMMDGQATICTKQEGKFTCMIATSENMITPTTNFTVTNYEDEITSEGEEEGKFKVYKDGTKTVAGTTAKCYAFEYVTSTTTKEQLCFSNEGVMLYHKLTSPNPEENSEFAATSYSATVSDSVFELPAGAEIIDLNQELADVQAEYGDEYQGIEDTGNCYTACDAQNLPDAQLETCYAACWE